MPSENAPEIIRREDFTPPIELLVGLDVTLDVARDLLERGVATAVPARELPEALRVLADYASSAGVTWPAGSTLVVNVDVSRIEAIALLRGTGGQRVAVPAPPPGGACWPSA